MNLDSYGLPESLGVTKSDILLEMKNFAEQILPEQRKKVRALFKNCQK